MADLTYCDYAGCPMKNCERHIAQLEDRAWARIDRFAVTDDFAPTCRDYMRCLVEAVIRGD